MLSRPIEMPVAHARAKSMYIGSASQAIAARVAAFAAYSSPRERDAPIMTMWPIAAARRLPVRRPMSSSSSAHAVAAFVSPRRASAPPDAAEALDLDVEAIVGVRDEGHDSLEGLASFDDPTQIAGLRGDPREPRERVALRRGVAATSSQLERFVEVPIGVGDALDLPRHHSDPRDPAGGEHVVAHGRGRSRWRSCRSRSAPISHV